MATRKLKPQFMAVTSPIPNQSKYKLISDLGFGCGSITEIAIVERHAFSGVHLGIDKHWWTICLGRSLTKGTGPSPGL